MDRAILDATFYKAIIAERTERFEELVEIMKGIAKQNRELSLDERNLLTVGYAKVLDVRRNSWRTIHAIEKRELESGDEVTMNAIKTCRQKVEDELSTIINEILTILDGNLLPSSASIENAVHYFKLKGDFYRYLAEFKTDEERHAAVNLSDKAYEVGYNMATEFLPAIHPVRLAISLNYSVFYYEIMRSKEQACEMAQDAFDRAVSNLDPMHDEDYNDSPVLLEILKDNLMRWRPPIPETGSFIEERHSQRELEFEMRRERGMKKKKINPLLSRGSMILPILVFIAVITNKSNIFSVFKWRRN